MLHARAPLTRLRAILFVLAMLLLLPTQLHAQVQELLGNWQQLSSNAGACPSCQISFSGGSSQLTVTANNGWSAVVEARETREAGTMAAGRGSWRAGTGVLASKPFTIEFTLRGERLYMTMTNDLGNGRKRIVRGVFGRPWLGA